MRVARIFATVAAATAAGVAFGTPAYASDITLNPAHKGKFANSSEFEQKCSDPRFADRQPNQDAWHFVLPGGGEFTSLTVVFESDGVPDENPADDVTFTGSDFVFYDAGENTKHAYLFTPAGYQTIDGSGTATQGDSFNVSHACAGTKPSSSASPSTSPSPSTPNETPTPDPSVTTSPSGGGGQLPRTGTATSVIVIGGVALVAGGVALLAIRRRRDMISG